MDDVIAKMTLLQSAGIRFSLDDFGTGFSSLQYLADMPIDYLKIDRSFVVNLFNDAKTLAVVKSILFLAKQLNLKVRIFDWFK